MFQKQPPRQFSKISVLFSRSNLFIIFQECPFVPQTDMNFSGGSICSSNRHEFSRRAYRKDMFFSRRFYLFVKQNLVSHLTDINFPRNPYLVLELTYEFSRSLYFLIEQILIFQEALSSPRAPTIFQENPLPRTHRHFCTPSRTDISLIGLGGCFRCFLCRNLFSFYIFFLFISRKIQRRER